MRCAEECVWWYGDDDDDEGDFCGWRNRKKEVFCVCVRVREREHGLFFSLLDPGFNSNEIMTEADATCYTPSISRRYIFTDCGTLYTPSELCIDMAETSTDDW